MRNYWIRILVGALGIFVVGMIGVTLARKGVGKVNDVVRGSGPISLPLSIIPFELGGSKLGNLSRVVLERSSPKQITSVRLEADLDDSLVAQGLIGCRLAANFDADRDGSKGVHIRTGRGHSGMFRCLSPNDADSTFTEFGQAVLQPGDVTLPLLLPADFVKELQSGSFFSDSSETADSLEQAMEALGDSIEAAQEARMDSLQSRMDSLREQHGRVGDSLRIAGRIRVDSIKKAALHMADSVRAATLKGDASRPR